MTEQPIKTAVFQSQTGDRDYTACRYETFDTCTCSGFKFRKNCKHVQSFDAKDDETN